MIIIDPPQARFFESWEPLKDFFYQDQNGWIMPDIARIRSLADHYDFVLANCSSEHWGSERDFPLVARLHDILAEHYAKDFLCLCHDPSDQSLGDHILYFPFHAWRKRWQSLCPDLIAISDRTYLFSNLNHMVRDFRIANYLWWKKKPYASQCLISMHSEVGQKGDYDGHFGLLAEELEEWQKVLPTLPTMIGDSFHPVFDVRHPAFADSYLHLVSETTIKDKIFLTEKTWQTILAGQLLMVWGNAGSVSHLRDLGVDVFDDIVDHGYDAVADHRTRLSSIHDELDRLASLDWHKIYDATLARRLDNAQKFFNGVFIKKHVDLVANAIGVGIPT